ncbi:MAG: hypothetical protein ACJ765_15545 [Chloroflexota bacterium]
MTDQPVQGGSRRRPLGVFVVAAVEIVRAALIFTQTFALSLFPNADVLRIAAQVPEAPPGGVAFALTRGVAIGMALASILAAVGLLSGRRWGWVGAIILSGLSLAFSIGAWWDGHAGYLSMLINIIAVFYLNQRDVRAVFESPDAAAPDEVRP